jgi:hypothetical protein
MRNRMIKVDFWSDEKVGSVGLLSRLLFIGSWTIADDSGVCRAHPVFLKNQLFPYDEKITKKNIEDSLSEIVAAGLVSFIDYQGETYIYINNFTKHQQINRPSDHRFIEAEGDDYTQLIEQSVSNHGGLHGKVKEKVKVNVKENINHAQSECLAVWDENLEKFKAKYPLLDYDLQRDLILQWIEDNPKKSLKKSNWNLFIQNWLSRSKRMFVGGYQQRPTTHERIRPNTEEAQPLSLDERIAHKQALLEQYKGRTEPRLVNAAKAIEREIAELQAEGGA